MTFATFQQQIQPTAGTTSSTVLAHIKEAINLAYRKMCSVSPLFWVKEQKDLTVVPAETYAVGSITATHDSVDITGAGTTWTAGMTGRTILIGAVEYVFTRVTDTTATLDRVFEGETGGGKSYLIVTATQHYDLDAGCRQVLRIRPAVTMDFEITLVGNDVWDELITDWDTTGDPVLAKVEDRGAADEMHIYFHPTPDVDASGTYKYDAMMRPSDMSADGDEPIFGSEWDTVLIAMARAELFKILGDAPAKIQSAQADAQPEFDRFTAFYQRGADGKGA